MYTHPNANDDVTTAIFQEINRASMYGIICIVGNLNYGSIDCFNLTGDSQAEIIIKIIRDNFLKQLIGEPTRSNNIKSDFTQ